MSPPFLNNKGVIELKVSLSNSLYFYSAGELRVTLSTLEFGDDVQCRAVTTSKAINYNFSSCTITGSEIILAAKESPSSNVWIQIHNAHFPSETWVKS